MGMKRLKQYGRAKTRGATFMREYAFDIKLSAVVRALAETEGEAIEKLDHVESWNLADQTVSSNLMGDQESGWRAIVRITEVSKDDDNLRLHWEGART